MEFLFAYGLFLAKMATLVLALMAILVVIKTISTKSGQVKGELKITQLTEQYKATVAELESYLYEDSFLSARDKEQQKKEKQQKKQQEKQIKKDSKAGELVAQREPHLFVLDFKGSLDAKEVNELREEITAILSVAQPQDEVLVRLESGGGMVHGYGLAASQLKRIKEAGLSLTVAVDKVAASGGYMMACIADKIIAAPFAILGSIGVVAQLPNFNKLLKKHDIEFEQLTAGEYKRTLTMFGENSDKAREKFQQELEETHELFKTFIQEHRPSLDLEKLATGEHWFGSQALALGLIDAICTSDELIMQACQQKSVLALHYQPKKKLANKLSGLAAKTAEQTLFKLISRGQKPVL